jgi:triacylglycerol lipase
MPTLCPYNGPSARICAELSNLIYRNPVEIKERVGTLVANAKVTLHNISVGNSRICVVSGEKEIFVIFRGTVKKSPRSIIANLRVTRTRWGNGLVHRGFLKLFLAAAPFIHQALRDYDYKVEAKDEVETRKLYFTGHSQGGATAYIAALIFARGMQSPKANAIYTFGQPRAGDAEFSRDAEKRLRIGLSRITNGRDIIVGVPFVWNGYDHTRDYFHYGQNRLLTRRALMAGQELPFFNACVGDHDMVKYLCRSQVNEHLPPP